MKLLPVGIAGVGHLGEAHVKKYLALPEAELIGFWDIDERVRTTIENKYEITAFDSLESLLEHVQALSVVVPTSDHADVAVAAAERGVHVFVEKPIGANLAETDRIINAAHKSNVKLQVGHIERFNSAFRSLTAGGFAKRNLDAAVSYADAHLTQIKPRFIESHRLASFNIRGMDVSVILDLMIHDLDLILQLIPSPIERIDTSGVGVISDTFDIVNARLIFANGAAANVTASRISQKNMRKMRLFQKDSYISMDFVRGETKIFMISTGDQDGDIAEPRMMPVMKLDHDKVTKTIGYKKIPNDGKDALELELSSFIETIMNNADPPVSGEEARKVLETALLIVEKTAKT